MITGGEPTLHHDLPHFIDLIKKIGLQVKLDTNGTNPEMVENLLASDQLDYIAMDIKAPWQKYRDLTGTTKVDFSQIKRSIEIVSNSSLPHLFRTTFPPHLLHQEDLDFIKKMLPAESTYVVQPYQKVVSSCEVEKMQ